MNEDNNERLASVYQCNVYQIIVVGTYVWVHAPKGNWFISAFIMEDSK